MKMKELIKVNYKSIFKYEDHQETVKYAGAGYLLQQGNRQVISYQDGQMIKIELEPTVIVLHNGKSVLKLVKDQDVLNHYQTDYGVIDLTTRLISYDYGNTIKIKYELYDGTSLISQVYILIGYQILEN